MSRSAAVGGSCRERRAAAAGPGLPPRSRLLRPLLMQIAARARARARTKLLRRRVRRPALAAPVRCREERQRLLRLLRRREQRRRADRARDAEASQAGERQPAEAQRAPWRRHGAPGRPRGVTAGPGRWQCHRATSSISARLRLRTASHARTHHGPARPAAGARVHLERRVPGRLHQAGEPVGLQGCARCSRASPLRTPLRRERAAAGKGGPARGSFGQRGRCRCGRGGWCVCVSAGAAVVPPGALEPPHARTRCRRHLPGARVREPSRSRAPRTARVVGCRVAPCATHNHRSVGDASGARAAPRAGKYVVLFFYPLDFTFVCPVRACV